MYGANTPSSGRTPPSARPSGTPTTTAPATPSTNSLTLARRWYHSSPSAASSLKVRTTSSGPAKNSVLTTWARAMASQPTKNTTSGAPIRSARSTGLTSGQGRARRRARTRTALACTALASGPQAQLPLGLLQVLEAHEGSQIEVGIDRALLHFLAEHDLHPARVDPPVGRQGGLQDLQEAGEVLFLEGNAVLLADRHRLGPVGRIAQVLVGADHRLQVGDHRSRRAFQRPPERGDHVRLVIGVELGHLDQQWVALGLEDRALGGDEQRRLDAPGLQVRDRGDSLRAEEDEGIHVDPPGEDDDVLALATDPQRLVEAEHVVEIDLAGDQRWQDRGRAEHPVAAL